MTAALTHRENWLKSGGRHEKCRIKKDFEQALTEALPGSIILSSSVDRLWNTTAVLMPPADCHARWVVKLDKLGFAVSTGSACASGKETPSHVLLAMGYAGEEAGRALRFSAGWETEAEDWTQLLEALKRVREEVGQSG